jgi:hypothetical protein
VFFYWVEIPNLPANTAVVVEIDQAITSSNNNFNHFFASASGSNAYTLGCTTLSSVVVDSNPTGSTTVSFTTTSAGTYVIGVKYSADMTGFTAPSPNKQVDYTFSTSGVPNTTQGISLKPKKP